MANASLVLGGNDISNVASVASSVGSPGSVNSIINAATKNALMRGKNFNRYDVIPLSFKGDGIGYTAGFGYNLNKGRSYGNFAKGFPLKYYRVYGNSVNNVTQKVARLRQNLDDTIKTAKNEMEARRMEITKKKEELAKKAAADRKLKETIAETERALKQQERNAALAMMEIERAESRAQENVATSAESLASASRALILDFQRSIEAKLANPEPGSGWETLARHGKKKYTDLDKKTRNTLEARFKLTPSFRNRLRRGTRLSNVTARRLNQARFALGAKPRSNYSFLKPKREGNYSGISGSYTGAPLFTGVVNNTRERGVSQAQIMREARENSQRAMAGMPRPNNNRPITQAQIMREARENSERAMANRPTRRSFLNRARSFFTRKNKSTKEAVNAAL